MGKWRRENSQQKLREYENFQRSSDAMVAFGEHVANDQPGLRPGGHRVAACKIIAPPPNSHSRSKAAGHDRLMTQRASNDPLRGITCCKNAPRRWMYRHICIGASVYVTRSGLNSGCFSFGRHTGPHSWTAWSPQLNLGSCSDRSFARRCQLHAYYSIGERHRTQRSAYMQTKPETDRHAHRTAQVGARPACLAHRHCTRC